MKLKMGIGNWAQSPIPNPLYKILNFLILGIIIIINIKST